MARDHNIRCVLVMALPLGNQMHQFFETKASCIALKLALFEGYRNVWIEGGSLNIINYLKGIQKPSWIIQGMNIGLFGHYEFFR